MSLRIDFDKYKKDDPEKVGGGLLVESMCKYIFEDKTLNGVIELIAQDRTIFWVSDGDWSMHDMLVALLNITGPAEVHISSYALGETQARVLSDLKEAGAIKKLIAVLDSRVDVRTAGSLQIMKSICDKLSLVDTHAKVTVVKNDEWSITVVGSANYTTNKRYESGVITTWPAAAEQQLKWINKALADGIQ